MGSGKLEAGSGSKMVTAKRKSKNHKKGQKYQKDVPMDADTYHGEESIPGDTQEDALGQKRT